MKKQTLRVITEKNVLRELSSFFVITLHETFQDKDNLYFLTEFVQGGDLLSYMVELEEGKLSDPVANFMSACLSEAIKHIHDRGFVHRDIKPENCLIDHTGYLKVADLGLTKRLPAVVEVEKGRTEICLLAFTICGTPEFMAPEFCMSVGYEVGADWWAFGCTLFEMYFGRNPFEAGGDLKRTFNDVCMIGMGKASLQLDPRFVEYFPKAADLLQRCLSKADTRIGKKDYIQKHPYYDVIDFDALRATTAEAPYVPMLLEIESNNGRSDERDRSRDSYDGDQVWCKEFGIYY